MSWNNKTVIFVPRCLLCPLLQAGQGEKNVSWNEVILQSINDRGFYVLDMPCPEVTFPDPECGIGRKPHGVQFYEQLPGFNEHCLKLSAWVVEQIKLLNQRDFCIGAILGIEHSPTCAINYMYTHKGTVRRSGIFINHLTDGLHSCNIDVRLIGINRRYPHNTISEICKL